MDGSWLPDLINKVYIPALNSFVEISIVFEPVVKSDFATE